MSNGNIKEKEMFLFRRSKLCCLGFQLRTKFSQEKPKSILLQVKRFIIRIPSKLSFTIGATKVTCSSNTVREEIVVLVSAEATTTTAEEAAAAATTTYVHISVALCSVKLCVIF